MALAILRFQESDGTKSRFQVDLGSNRFYTYAIGDGEVLRVNGLEYLKDPIYTSALIGPIAESSLGRTILEVPNDKFDRQHRAIQITSFRTAQRVGPALSEIVTVTSVGSEPSPAISLSLDKAMDKQPVETVAFQYREVPPVSEAMFLGGVLNAVKSVAGPLLGAVAGGAGGAGGAAAGGGGISSLLSGILPQLAGLLPQLLGGGGAGGDGTGQPASDGQMANQIASLLQQVGSGTAAAPGQDGAEPAALPVGNGVAAPPPPPPPPPPAAGQARPQPVMRRASAAPRRQMARARSFAMSAQDYYSPEEYDADAYGFSLASEEEEVDAYGFSAFSEEEEELDAYGFSAFSEEEEESPAYGLSLSSEYAGSMSAQYSESMFLSALASLAPSLLQMFGPQLMNMVSSLLNPQRGTARQMSTMLGIDEEDGEDEAVLIALSLAVAAAATPDISYRRVGEVTLAFTDVNPVMMHGKSRFLYRYDQDITFPIKIETPKPIKKARLQLLVKHPKTLKVLIEQNYPITDITSGALSVVPKLGKERLKTLAVNEEYLICITLVWQGRSKETGNRIWLGTSTLQLISLVGEYLFDRVEGTGEKVALNDVERFRPYWHKVWQGSFTDDLRRMTFECKYYYTLENNRSENARMETLTQVLEEDLAGRKSRMKSGLIVNPYGLNELLAQVSKYPRLSEAELSALVGSEFKGRFHHAARTQVKFKGRPRETVALWIYPEFKLQQVMLKRVERSNGNGHVLELKEHPVYFPMPAVAHFIGVGT